MAFVNYFATSPDLQNYINAFTKTQEGLANVVTSSLDDSPLNMCKKDYLGFDISIWRKMDCVLVYILGANPDYYHEMSIDPFHLTSAGIEAFDPTLFTLIAGALFTPVGPILLFLGVALVILLIAAFIQVIFIYITSLFAVVFLGIIAPMIIPLYLFQATKRIFDEWLTLMISYTLQPALLFAYLTFMLHAIGYALNGPCDAPVRCGYAAQLAEIEHGIREDKLNGTTFFATQKPLFALTDDPTMITAPATPTSGAGTTGSLLVTSINFAHGADKKIELLILNGIILLAVLKVTFEFMTTVIMMGAQMTGITAGAIGGVNFYSMAAQRVASSMRKRDPKKKG